MHRGRADSGDSYDELATFLRNRNLDIAIHPGPRPEFSVSRSSPDSVLAGVVSDAAAASVW